MDTVDTMLVGATTYNFFTEYLPESIEQADSFTDKIGSLSKYVVSTELKEAPWGAWEPATIIKDNVFDEITKLKEQSGKDIVIWGSMTLAHSLMKEGLIGEVQLRVIPTTLGKGKPVFDSAYDMKFLGAKRTIRDSFCCAISWRVNKLKLLWRLHTTSVKFFSCTYWSTDNMVFVDIAKNTKELHCE